MLVVLAASLFALIATAHAQGLCGSDTFGTTNWRDIENLPDVYMPAGAQTVMIVIGDNSCGPPGMVGIWDVGANVRACDYAAEPVVTMMNLTHAYVSRASYSSPGVVHTTIWCGGPPGMQL
ncbi:hypothetical protein ABMA28_013182 [Loxostege sticticalis]|uniref:Uncharacterized protein n=1 Tax=Loxostege sticticalis TaxID=481309 RepID=A0ABD0THG7_LOXSC